MGAVPSPPVNIMKSFFILLFLLITSCHTTPIDTALYHRTAAESHSNRNIKALPDTIDSPTDFKHPAPTVHYEDNSNARLSVRAAVSETTARNDAQSETEPINKQPETDQTSALNVIQPAIKAVLSDENNSRASRLTEKLKNVEYLSSPLRGTETRDRQALGIRYPEEPLAGSSNYDNTAHQHQHRSYDSPHLQPLIQQANLNDAQTHASRVYPDSSSPQHSQPAKGDVPNTDLPHPRRDSDAQKLSVPDPPIKETSHTTSQSTNYVVQTPSTMDSSKQVNSEHNDIETKSKDVSTLAKDMMKKTAIYGRAMFQQLKSALKSLTSKHKSRNSPTSRTKGKDGYTEEDVLNLVNDILKEIQSRTDDMRDHAAMLAKSERWGPHDITTNERHPGVRNGPLLYMKTKVLVTPETVVDAVMTSTKKMFSSRTQQLPWSETSKLLKDVQARLSEVLIPAK